MERNGSSEENVAMQVQGVLHLFFLMLHNIQTPILSRWEWAGIQLVGIVEVAEATMFGGKGCEMPTAA